MQKKTNDPLSDDKSINFILESFCHNLKKESAKNIEYLMRSFCNTPEEERNFIASLQINYLKTFEDLLIRLTELQKERIKKLLDLRKKTVAIYFPSCAYRDNLGNIAKRVRSKGYNALTFIGTVCYDKYEREKNIFYAGHGIISYMDFVDVFITPTLTFGLPINSKKIMFVHDIHDSPCRYADYDFLRLIMEFDYFFLPCQPVIERVEKQIAQAKDRLLGNTVKNKEISLIKGGYIKLDRNIKYFEKHKQNEKIIIYAPTVTMGKDIEDIVSVPEYGDKIVGTILRDITDHDLIFRPHPHTLNTSEVQNISKKYRNHSRFTFDDNASFYMENYSRSALMVTDMSGTAYTYAFSTLRPVIFFSHNENDLRERFDNLKYFEDRDKVGYVAENIEEMVEKIKLLLNNKKDFHDQIRDYRDSFMFNCGKTEDYFIDNLGFIIEGKKHMDWVYLKDIDLAKIEKDELTKYQDERKRYEDDFITEISDRIDKNSISMPIPLKAYKDYNLVRYKDRTYAILQGIDLDLSLIKKSELKKYQDERKCYVDNSVDEIKKRINKNGISIPIPLKAYKDYNLVKYEDRTYAILQGIDLDLSLIKRSELKKYQDEKKCYVHDSADEIKKCIDKNGISIPELLESYKNFNLVRYKGCVYAILQGISFDLAKTEKHELKKYQDNSMLFIGNSIDEVKDFINQRVQNITTDVPRK